TRRLHRTPSTCRGAAYDVRASTSARAVAASPDAANGRGGGPVMTGTVPQPPVWHSRPRARSDLVDALRHRRELEPDRGATGRPGRRPHRPVLPLDGLLD